MENKAKERNWVNDHLIASVAGVLVAEAMKERKKRISDRREEDNESGKKR